MTALEYSTFIYNFVRDENGKRLPHSKWKDYSKSELASIIPKINSEYLINWEAFLCDMKDDDELMSNYLDYKHFLYSLKHIDSEYLLKYELPQKHIVIK